MKRLVLIFAGVFISTCTLFAQAPDRYGIKISYGSSAADYRFQEPGNFTDTQDAYLAPNINLVAGWELNPWLNMRMEPGLVHRGFKSHTSSFFVPFGTVPDDPPTQVKMRYFSFPVLARIEPNWIFSPYLEAGPRLDMLLSREVTNGSGYEQQIMSSMTASRRVYRPG